MDDMENQMSKNHPERISSPASKVVSASALMMVVLVGLVAFSVDYGYLLKVRTDLQRSADAADVAEGTVNRPIDHSVDLPKSAASATSADRSSPERRTRNTDQEIRNGIKNLLAT
jgi:uncharacterized membrane protein